MELYFRVGDLNDVGEHAVRMEGRTFVEERCASVAAPYIALLESVKTTIDIDFSTQLSKSHGLIRVIPHQPDVGIVGSGIDLLN